MIAFINFDVCDGCHRYVNAEVIFHHAKINTSEKCFYCSSKENVFLRQVIIDKIDITHSDTAFLKTESEVKERIEKIILKSGLNERIVCENKKCIHEFDRDLMASFFRKNYILR